MTMQNIIRETEQLDDNDKWQLVKYLLNALEQKQTQSQSDWHERLRATRGSLAGEELERPSQLPLEEREPMDS